MSAEVEFNIATDPDFIRRVAAIIRGRVDTWAKATKVDLENPPGTLDEDLLAKHNFAVRFAANPLQEAARAAVIIVGELAPTQNDQTLLLDTAIDTALVNNQNWLRAVMRSPTGDNADQTV